MVSYPFGVELESFGLTGKQLNDAIKSAVPDARFVDNLHTHSGGTFFSGKTWQGMRDGSIGQRAPGRPNPRSYGMRPASWTRAGTHEIVSPVLPKRAGMKDMKKIMKKLDKAGAQVDYSTGVHVTFGLENTRWKRLGKQKRQKVINRLVGTYNWFGPGINTMLSPSRRGSRWALFNNPIGSLMDKYSAVNLSKFWKHGVVEFRQHQGTMNAEKVENWVNFLNKMINFSINEEFKDTNPTDFPRTFEGMAKALRLSDKQKNWWRGRIRELGGDSATGIDTGTPSADEVRRQLNQPTGPRAERYRIDWDRVARGRQRAMDDEEDLFPGTFPNMEIWS